MAAEAPSAGSSDESEPSRAMEAEYEEEDGSSIEEMLKTAVTGGDLEAVRGLIAQRADVRHAYTYGLTALHLASVHGHIDVVRTLIEARADVRATTTDGERMTPRVLAEIEGQVEIREVLMQAAEGLSSPVRLNIYDVGHRRGTSVMNRLFRPFGTGIFHAAVEVCGQEYSFGWTTPEMPTGIFSCQPCNCSLHHFRESVPMGETAMSEKKVEALLEQMKLEWHGPGYDFLRQNCCHFCDSFCIQLGVGPIPVWVKSLAATGASVDSRVSNAANTARRARRAVAEGSNMKTICQMPFRCMRWGLTNREGRRVPLENEGGTTPWVGDTS